MRTCRKCGAELPEAAGPGRPRSYCSVGCRRAAELEVRRLQRALENTEDMIRQCRLDRKSTRLNSSHGYISYAVFCLKKKKINKHNRSCSELSLKLIPRFERPAYYSGDTLP